MARHVSTLFCNVVVIAGEVGKANLPAAGTVAAYLLSCLSKRLEMLSSPILNAVNNSYKFVFFLV